MIEARRAQFLCLPLVSDRSGWLIIGFRKVAVAFGNNEDHEKFYAGNKEFRTGSGGVRCFGNRNACAERHVCHCYNSDSIDATTAGSRQSAVQKSAATNWSGGQSYGH